MPTDEKMNLAVTPQMMAVIFEALAIAPMALRATLPVVQELEKQVQTHHDGRLQPELPLRQEPASNGMAAH